MVRFYLVVSELYPSGTVRTEDEYITLRNRMSYVDVQTHQAVPISGELAFLMADIIDTKSELRAINVVKHMAKSKKTIQKLVDFQKYQKQTKGA